MNNKTTRIYIKDLSKHVGQSVVIKGWVAVRRDQGKMVFMDMRDMTGIVQSVALPSHVEVIEYAKDIRTEWVLAVTGIVNKRPERNIKADVTNGDIELEITGIEVLNQSETVPFDIGSDTRVVGEETRLAHRYVDLRSDRMQTNLRTATKLLRIFAAS